MKIIEFIFVGPFVFFEDEIQAFSNRRFPAKESVSLLRPIILIPLFSNLWLTVVLGSGLVAAALYKELVDLLGRVFV